MTVPSADLGGQVAVFLPPHRGSGIWKPCSSRWRCFAGMVFVYLVVGVD